MKKTKIILKNLKFFEGKYLAQVGFRISLMNTRILYLIAHIQHVVITGIFEIFCDTVKLTYISTTHYYIFVCIQLFQQGL